MPAYCLAALECARNHHGIALCILYDLARQRIALPLRAALLPNVKGNGVGASGGGGVQVEIDSNQEVPGADIDGSALRDGVIVLLRSEVRMSGRIRHFLGEGFIFAGAADRKILALRLERRRFITITRNPLLLGNSFGELSGQLCAFFKSDSRNRYQRQDISGS